MATRPLRVPRKQPKTLDAVHPNAGLQMAYQRKLLALVDDMHASIIYWLRAAYRANTPEMAQDAGPARELQGTMRRLSKRWMKNFDEAAPQMAKWFATTAADRSDAALEGILRKAGFSIEFKLTDEARDVLNATNFENVSLIRTIAQQHLAEVEGLVMRAASQGRDLKGLTEDLFKRYDITRNRAIFIARDQNNKATATITRVRQQGLGITEAIWRHSRGGKHPRESHVKFSGQKYEIAKGAYLDGKWVWPGTEINCRCVSRSVIPGLD